LALDTNLLFDLAADKDFAHTFREVYQERGYSLVVPPMPKAIQRSVSENGDCQVWSRR